MKYYEYHRNQSTPLYYCISIYYINESEFTNFLKISIFIPGSGYKGDGFCHPSFVPGAGSNLIYAYGLCPYSTPRLRLTYLPIS